MTRASSFLLDTGSPFPRLEWLRAGGGLLSLPADLAHAWNVVLLNRGHW